MITLSRRSVLAGSAAAVIAPGLARAAAPDVHRPSGSVLDLRGVRIGEHAILRTAGTATCEATARVWRFAENTLVSWTARDDGTVMERREGRIQLTAHTGRTVEISTGPVEERLTADGPATLLMSGGAQRLLVSAATLTPSDAWDILEHAALPPGVAEFRVFTPDGAEARAVTWALRSPWLADLGEGAPSARLTWRGQGRLSAWRGA